MYPSNGLMAVLPRFQPLVQGVDIVVQLCTVLLFGDTIHAYRSGLPLAVKNAFEYLLIYQMCQ
jgi:hypothetical protein